MKIESKVTLLPAYHIPLTCPQKGQTSLELDMSNENNEVSLAQESVATQPQNLTPVKSETLEAISQLEKEIHQVLQLPPEDRAKIDHIEWRLDWKPVLSVSLFPKNP